MAGDSDNPVCIKWKKTSSMVQSLHMTPSDWLRLCFLSLLWGGSFFFVGVAIKTIPVLTLVVARTGGAALVLIFVLLLSGGRLPRNRGLWLAFFVIALLNNVIPHILISWGQSHIPSGLAAILNAATPLTTVLLAHLLTDDEKLTPGRLIGVLVGLSSVILMIGPEALLQPGVGTLAQIAILMATVSYALAGIYGRRFKALNIRPMEVASGQMAAATIMIAPFWLIVDQPWTLPAPTWTEIAALVGLATLSTALAYVLYFRILASAGAVNILLVTFLIPISAMVLGILFLHEVLTLRALLGMMGIGLGLALIDGRLPDRLQRRMRLSAPDE